MELFRRVADARNTRVWANNLKYERLKLENKVNSKKCLFYCLKIFQNLFWSPQHLWGAQGTVARPYNQEKQGLLTIGTRFLCGNWSLIGLFFSISALKPVYFSHFNIQWLFIFYLYDNIFYIMIIVQCAAVINSIKTPKVSVCGSCITWRPFCMFMYDFYDVKKVLIILFLQKEQNTGTPRLMLFFGPWKNRVKG